MKYVRNNQAGFSLVELMVVVAIIGILASLAIPSIGKYMAKARQSEAKTQLSSLYTAEKAFYAEYTAYHGQFGPVGYSPEGKLRYVVGFSGATNADATNGYTAAAPTAPGDSLNTLAYCSVAATMTNGCMMLSGATALAPVATNLGTAVLTKTAFVAGAGAIIHANGLMDQWSINNSKDLRIVNDGIR